MSAATVEIKAKIQPDENKKRYQIKQILSEELGIPFGKVSDHLIYNLATEFLFEGLSNGKKAELVQRIKAAYTKPKK